MESPPVLSDASTQALRMAAGRRIDDGALTTGAVFAVLAEIDMYGGWERLWLETGDARSLRLDEAPDHGGTSPTRWNGIALTTDLADALSLLEVMRRAYDIDAATPALMAVALVADPASGAARRLTAHGLSHDVLLDIMQSEILDSTLENLAALVARQRRRTEPPHQTNATKIERETVLRPSPPAGTTAPRRARPRLRRAGWVTVSVLAILAIIFAIRTSPSFHSALPPVATPPYTPPPLAVHMLTTADVQAALGVPSVELQDRPPSSKIWTSTSPLAYDLRSSAIVAGWQREWSSADQARLVIVRAVNVTKPEFLTSFRDICSPTVSASVPVADVAVKSGFVIHQKDIASFCLVSEAGNLSIYTFVAMQGTSAPAATSSAAQRLAARQLDLFKVYDSVPAAVHPTHYSRDSINRWLILAAILAPLVLFLPITMIDRATWRRLRRRLRWRAARDPFVVSVDPVARLALSEATALGLVKVAVYVWLLRLSETLLIGTFKTAALLLVAFCLIALGESRLLHGRRGAYSPQPFRGLNRFLAVGGLILTAAVVAVAFFIADASLSLASLGLNPLGADYITTRLGPVGVGVSLVVLALAVVPLMVVRRLAMRRLRQEAQNSPGRHIVLLRSFADDKRRIRARRLDRASIVDRLCLRRWERFEEIVATALSTIGPVIALGRPGERLPPALGAVRQQFAMDAWQDGVRELIRESALVCMVVGRTQSLVIELGETKRVGALGRTLFLIPPCGRAEQRRRLAILARELSIPWSRMVQATRGRDALLVVANADPDRALIFTARAPDDVGYETAINAAALLIGQPVGASVVTHRLVTDVRDRVAGVGPSTSVAPSPPPAVHVYPPGQAPIYRPMYRRFAVLPWVLSIASSVVVAPVIAFVVGYNLHKYPGVATGSGTATSLTEDDATGQLYAAIDGRLIVTLDPAKQKAVVVGTTTVYIDDLIVHGTTAYGTSSISGEVTAVDVAAHRVLWTIQLPSGLRGLALDGNRLVTTMPAKHEVVAFSVGDGRQVAKQAVDGTPWGVTVSGDQLVVPIVDQARLAYLTTANLQPAATVTTVPGPQRVLDQGALLWVIAPTEDRALRRLAAPTEDADRGQLLLSEPDALTSANVNWFAIQGSGRVTLVTAAGDLVRVPLPYDAISSMYVTRSGHLFVGVEGNVAQLR